MRGVKIAMGLVLVMVGVTCSVQAQQQLPISQLAGQQGRRVITTAVPFLSFAPDSRASGMGDVGVATSPTANSAAWNSGKLAFIDKKFGASISYSPWLRKIVNDMSLAYLSGYYKLDKVQTLGLQLRYFDLGKIHLTQLNAANQVQQLGIDNPREWALGVTYSRKLSEKFGIGVSARYVSSNLVSSTTSAGRPGSSFAVDLGVYYAKPIAISGKLSIFSWGATITNIGAKVTYGSTDDADFLPTNLRLGTALKVGLDAYNSLTFAIDFNKLLVPTPPIYVVRNGQRVISNGQDPNRNFISGMFGSFTDAPGGFTEEMQEIVIATGLEYWYRTLFAARFGYFHENKNKGSRQYFTLGLGFRYQKFGIDFSYLIPTKNGHPLAETIRFSLLFNFKQEEKDAKS